jgi:hypothetical protein
MTPPTKPQTLLVFADRIAYIVTDLNGLISSLVNDEVTPSDFGDDLTELFEKLDQVEEAVSDLANLFWT